MTDQQKNNRILDHQNYHLIGKPVVTFKNPDEYQNYLGICWKIQMPRYYFYLLSCRYVSNEKPGVKATGLCDDLLFLSSFTFSVSYSMLPFHVV